MKTMQIILASLLVALMGHVTTSQAEDTDIYSGLGGAAGKPNVLIVFDNAANFSSDASGSSCVIDGVATALSGTVGGIEQCAFYNVINSLPVDVVNIGMMVYNSNNIRDINNSNCGGSDGGCLVVPLTTMTAANKTPLLSWIKSWVTTGGAGNGYIKAAGEATAATMQEAWAYYSGGTGLSGRSYAGIKPAAGCQQNFVIFIGNSFSSAGSPGDGGTTSPASALASAPGVTAAQTALITSTYATTCGTYTFPTSAHEGKGFYADEWARYMREHDLYSSITETQKITTYTIGLLGPSCQAEYAATLNSMADVGGGKYFATTDYSSITQALLKILNEVQAVNSVFSSSSLPVSVNTQGTYLNQIYMGMFRPDSGGYPRWVGNLKQYQFIYDPVTQSLKMGDSLGDPAISSAGTGFISPNAVSYWTCGGNPSVRACSPVADPTNGFWFNNKQGAGGTYDLPDGELVEKGGAAQVMRLANLTNDYATDAGTSTNPRKLYTYCPSGTGCNATLSNSGNAFATSNTAITDAMLGTGARTISSITSAATTQATGTVPNTSGAAAAVSITAFTKSGSTVTATVSATDLAKLSISPATQLKIATGQSKYNCDPCTVTAINTSTNTFTYTGSSGTQAAPSTPYVASIYTNFATLTFNNHGLPVGQTVTLSACTTYTTLNGTINTVSSVTSNTFTIATNVALAGTASDTGCRYTPNTATVTTSAAHGFPSMATIAIAGAGGSTTTPYTGYNGSWSITVTGTNTFTYQYTTAAPLTSFSSSGATATNVGSTRNLLINWVRGEDNFGDEASRCPPGTPAGTNNCPNPAITVRPSFHGDVLHSRPVVINYGGTTGVIVFYGANDGVYRAVNGNQANPSGSSLPVPGSELWGFIPTEFFGKLDRQRNNSPQLLLPTTPAGILPAPLRKDYFADGSTGVYQLMNADGTTQTAYIYMAMRRGGRLIYALDVSTPTSPHLLWKIDPTGLTTSSGLTASTDFAELGQTWSAPKVASVEGYANPVLIFGAGYDTAEDTEPPTTNTMGRGIFIVDAITGALVWSAAPQPSGATACSGTTTKAACLVSGMDYSIPADITLVDRDGNGKIDRLYAVDVGGNVWRVDLQPTAAHKTPNYWQVNKLAALGCAAGVCSNGPPRTTPRKFFYPADVVTSSGYDAVLVGQGDREHPLFRDASVSIRNRFYMLKDLHTGNDGSGATAIIRAKLFDATTATYDAALPSTGDNTTPNLGYYISLGDGEKVVNAPLTVAGYTYFGTNQPVDPDANSCSVNLGIARGYKIKPIAGTFTSATYAGGGLPPSPVAGLVSIQVTSSTGETTEKFIPFCIGCGGTLPGPAPTCSTPPCPPTPPPECSESALEGCKPAIDVPTSRTRTYWYFETDQ